MTRKPVLVALGKTVDIAVYPRPAAGAEAVTASRQAIPTPAVAAMVERVETPCLIPVALATVAMVAMPPAPMLAVVDRGEMEAPPATAERVRSQRQRCQEFTG